MFHKSLFILGCGVLALSGTAQAQKVNFGTNSGEYTNDGECDDSHFIGEGMGALSETDAPGEDSADCRKLYEAGKIQHLESLLYARGDRTDYGNDSSDYAYDGECDDPRFSGNKVADGNLESDRRRDATDCRFAVYNGASLKTNLGGSSSSTDISYGDNSSDYAHDDECDDPRFSGPGVADFNIDDDIGRDAADCKRAIELGASFDG